MFTEAERLRGEFVLAVEGRVRERPAGTINPNLRDAARSRSLATKLDVLAKAKTPPFHHDEAASEELRLRYRYLDLRREEMQRNLRLRHAVTRALRGFMDDHGFIDVETPMLTKTTPEGARDYLVPSRTQTGNFFALPQSPQLMKQLLMMSGLDRYYQIVKCFRDEDLRADRQPEFTQLDIETSFMSEDEIMELMEELVRDCFKSGDRRRAAEAVPAHDLRGRDAPLRQRQARYAQPARARRGRAISSAASSSRYSRHLRRIPRAGSLRSRLPRGGELTRKEIDDYTALVGAPRREGSRVHQGQRAQGKGATACNRRSSSSCPMRRSRACSSARRRGRRRPRVLRRRQGEGRQRVDERAADRARPRPQALDEKPLGAALGRRLSDVRRRARRRLDGGAPPVHGAARLRPPTSCARIRAVRWPRRTTSC